MATVTDPTGMMLVSKMVLLFLEELLRRSSISKKKHLFTIGFLLFYKCYINLHFDIFVFNKDNNGNNKNCKADY